jgi:hypothetical protein
MMLILKIANVIGLLEENILKIGLFALINYFTIMKLLFSGILFTILSACNSTDQKPVSKNIKEFEGIITYKITYKNNPDSLLYGDTLKIFYSKGNFIKQYNGMSPKGLNRELFLKDNSQYYMQTGASDTLYSFDIRQKDVKLLSSKQSVSTYKILGYDCEQIEMNQVYMSDYPFAIFNSYTYSRNILPINAVWFKDWNYGNFNQFIQESGSFYLRFETGIQYGDQKELVTKIFEAIEIKEQVLDSSLFAIDILKIKPFSVN